VIIAAALLLLVPQKPNEFKGKVKSVIDGDTLELLDGRIVRYIGVDMPRMKEKEVGTKNIFSIHPLSEEAIEFNEKLVLNKFINLEFDVQEKDRYGRVQAYCFLKDNGKEIFLNRRILEEGLGYLVVEEPNIKYLDSFILAQSHAQKQNKGFWKDQKAISPNRAQDYIGERKFVTGKIVSVGETSRTIILKFHSRRNSYLKLVIYKNYLHKFSKSNIDIRRFYIGKRVRVFGFIGDYAGPEMVVFSPVQIEILD